MQSLLDIVPCASDTGVDKVDKGSAVAGLTESKQGSTSVLLRKKPRSSDLAWRRKMGRVTLRRYSTSEEVNERRDPS